ASCSEFRVYAVRVLAVGLENLPRKRETPNFKAPPRELQSCSYHAFDGSVAVYRPWAAGSGNNQVDRATGLSIRRPAQRHHAGRMDEQVILAVGRRQVATAICS